jgi:hypothetical protein
MRQPLYHVIKLHDHRWIVIEYVSKAVVASGSPAACEAAARLLNTEAK